MNNQKNLHEWVKLGPTYHSRFVAQALDDWADLATAKLRRDAFPHMDRLEELHAKRLAKPSDLYAHLGAAHRCHALKAEPILWLDISETQVAKGLAHFLKQDAPKGVHALLTAIDPEFGWPDYFDEAIIELEVPCKCDRFCPCGGQKGNSARIDMLVHALRDSQQWGAVIELKINNQKVTNPLSNYLRFVGGNTCEHVKYRLSPRNARFVVLAPHESAHTKRRLMNAANRDWSHLDWPTFLKRLERNISESDVSFAQFRKLIWDKLFI